MEERALDEAAVISVLTDSAPGLAARRRTEPADDDSQREILGRMAHAVVDATDRGDTTELPSLFAAIERILSWGAPAARDLVGWSFLEDLQTISSHHPGATDELSSYLGPRTADAWRFLDQLWDHAAANSAPDHRMPEAEGDLHPEVRRLVEGLGRPGGASVADLARLERDGELRRPPWKERYSERYPRELRTDLDDPLAARKRLDHAVNGRLGDYFRATSRRRRSPLRRRDSADRFGTLDDYYGLLDCLYALMVPIEARVRIMDEGLAFEEAIEEFDGKARLFDELTEELGWRSDDPDGANARDVILRLAEKFRPDAAR